MRGEILIRIVFGWTGAVMVTFMAGVVQAIWLASHNRPWGPFDTIGAPIAFGLMAAGIVAVGVAAIWFAIRGFQ